MHRVAALAFFALVGCGDLASQVCSRSEECRLLRGVSESECAQTLRDARDRVSEAVRQRCEQALEDCLGRETCLSFGECVLATGC